jgi:hypothetical protein
MRTPHSEDRPRDYSEAMFQLMMEEEEAVMNFNLLVVTETDTGL